LLRGLFLAKPLFARTAQPRSGRSHTRRGPLDRFGRRSADFGHRACREYRRWKWRLRASAMDIAACSVPIRL